MAEEKFISSLDAIEEAMNREEDPAETAFFEKIAELSEGKSGTVKTLYTFEEYEAKLQEILNSDAAFSIDYLKIGYYWGIFDSYYTQILPKEFVKKFEEGYYGDNEELLFRLFYLDRNFSSVLEWKREEIEKVVNECIVLAK